MSSDESDLTPESIKLDALGIVHNLLPEKSKEKYLKAYNDFDKWKTAKVQSLCLNQCFWSISSIYHPQRSQACFTHNMPAMIFDQCCGCIELRTGCLIIGYLNLVGEILLIILGLLGVIAGGVVVAADGKEQEVELGAGVLVVSIIVLLVVFFLLAFTIVLLVGLHQSKRGHVKAYLIYAVIFLVIYIVLFFASFASPVTVGGIIKELITILLSIYFILVIRSYYYKMDDASKRPAVYNTA